MWTCVKCGERVEDQFDSCWNCARPLPPYKPESSSRRWRFALLFGFLFEVVLIAAAFLSRDTSLVNHIFNVVTLTHAPVYLFANFLGVLALPLGFVAMVFVWAVLFYMGAGAVTSLLDRRNVTKNRRRLLAWSVCIAFIAVLGWGATGITGGKPRPFNSGASTKTLVEGNNAFALDLYHRLKEQPGNLFFSPYSISMALGMTYAGARGDTESEMAAVLHFDMPQSDLHSAFGTLASRMHRVQRGDRLVLNLANSLWCQKDESFLETFLDLARTHYGAEVQFVDFKQASAANEINAWVEKKTQGRIKGAAPQEATKDASLVLCNAIYFNGNWAVEFDRSDTKESPFFVSSNHTVTVQMMYQKESFKTARVAESSLELIELPYFGRDLSMIVLLPDEIADIEPNLNTTNLRAWLATLDKAEPRETAVRLPRFTTTQSLDLENELRAMGMKTLFDRAKANFSGIDGRNGLFVSAVLHKAFVEVNEKGTEAAAATVVTVGRSAASTFNVDHPFIFLIRDNGSGSILFLGRILDPTK